MWQIEFSPFLKRGTIVIVESSVSIGTTKTMGEIIEKMTGMKIGIDFGIGILS